MASKKVPFTKAAHCQVVQAPVRLSGVLVSLPGAAVPPECIRKSCSNAEVCLRAHDSLDSIAVDLRDAA